MQRNHFIRALSTSPLALLASAGGVQAQSFLDRPLRVVVPFPAGNTIDAALRQFGEEFKKNTGQQLLIDNKPGGFGVIAAQAVMNATADGSTVLMGHSGIFAINPMVFAKLPYDAEKTFRHLSTFLSSSMVMAVNAANVPANDVKQFVTWAKTRPGQVNYASFAPASSSQFAGLILNKLAGIEMIHVPYNGTPPVVQNLVGGQVHAAYVPLMAVKQHVESGKVKVLAVTSPKRSALLPEVPTFTEQGYPELEISIWSSFSVLATTPDAVATPLHAALVKALRAHDVREKWRPMDFEPMPSTPDEVGQLVREDARRMADAVKISGIKLSG
jgi:tripartite-type tricarboxylate transporter receptor subunit TctC